MLDPRIRRRLESITKIPTIPYVISQVLAAVDNENLSASALAKLIERDQTLAMRVLTVANSPFYGFSRRISTIDLAIVILGLNAIKEIVLSLALQRFFAKIGTSLFDVRAFWKYSVFCGAAGRVLARKLDYKLPGEAFVAGLVHDIGILILIQYFTHEYSEISKLQVSHCLTFIEAEKKVINCTHADIGAWLAKKWKLPQIIEHSVLFHHQSFIDANITFNKMQKKKLEPSRDEFDKSLTAIVALSEWFAREMGYKEWTKETGKGSYLFLADEIVNELSDNDVLSPDSVIGIIKQEISDEYIKASTLSEMINRAVPLYK